MGFPSRLMFSPCCVQINAVLREHPASGVYSAAAFDAGTLHDLSGHGRDATVTAGIVSVRTASGHGTSNEVVALAGNTSAKVLWPVGSIPVIFTVCSVTRYDDLGETFGRILNCHNSPDQPLNWVHGQAYGMRGVAYYGDQLWNTAYSHVAEMDWLVMCGTNDASVAVPGNIVLDQVGSPSEPRRYPPQRGAGYVGTVCCLAHHGG